mmetsp:Transcript_20262/g.57017  ORF Transcript_20262/g.57017 Transcript_20262/m.57017 type:complete len:216 (-) Transcript_20262:34-681(-)
MTAQCYCAWAATACTQAFHSFPETTRRPETLNHSTRIQWTCTRLTLTPTTYQDIASRRSRAGSTPARVLHRWQLLPPSRPVAEACSRAHGMLPLTAAAEVQVPVVRDVRCKDALPRQTKCPSPDALCRRIALHGAKNLVLAVRANAATEGVQVPPQAHHGGEGAALQHGGQHGPSPGCGAEAFHGAEHGGAPSGGRIAGAPRDVDTAAQDRTACE